jgi:hypothetical protein
VNVPEKKLPASCTDNWDLSVLLLAFITAKFICADFAAYKAAILVFINRLDQMFGGQTFFLEYLKNALSGDADKPTYFRHTHEQVRLT